MYTWQDQPLLRQLPRPLSSQTVTTTLAARHFVFDLIYIIWFTCTSLDSKGPVNKKYIYVRARSKLIQFHQFLSVINQVLHRAHWWKPSARISYLCLLAASSNIRGQLANLLDFPDLQLVFTISFLPSISPLHLCTPQQQTYLFPCVLSPGMLIRKTPNIEYGTGRSWETSISTIPDVLSMLPQFRRPRLVAVSL
jgi:hypothetical protein